MAWHCMIPHSMAGFGFELEDYMTKIKTFVHFLGSERLRRNRELDGVLPVLSPLEGIDVSGAEVRH